MVNIASLFNVLDNLYESKNNAAKGMIKFGNPFFKALGNALANADQNNSKKLYKYYRAEWFYYERLYKESLLKQPF